MTAMAKEKSLLTKIKYVKSVKVKKSLVKKLQGILKLKKDVPMGKNTL